MQNFKVKTPNPEMSELVQRKLFELGYTWASGDQIIRLSERFGLCSYMETRFYSLYLYTFDSCSHPEISYEDFMRLGEPEINNQNTNIMSEIKLKLGRAPKAAKNITVGREYTGILTDKDDTQVDDIRSAAYFRCTNNSGIEARYSIGLFEANVPAPPPPPPPPVATWADLVNTLEYENGDVRYSFNGRRVVIMNLEGLLETTRTKCSCGILSTDGINELYDIIEERVGNLQLPFEIDQDELITVIFKLVVKNRLQDHTFRGFVNIFSTTTSQVEICDLMNYLLDNHENGGHDDIGINPNSANEIKYWIFNIN